MPRGRRARTDSDATAPVDGDYALDRLKNQEKGRKYFFADAEDAQRLQAFGAVVERRREGGVAPMFDLGGEANEVLKIRGGLALHSMTEAQHKVYLAGPQREADERTGQMEAQARASGGDYTRQAR